ncbi:MAG: excinuclease ABC subunit UvrC [Clostridia bacterium]|jgi:excinuclease ABC subunit C|nr:excinuclease ABC subunit UvrC [Clostridia bacterium]
MGNSVIAEKLKLLPSSPGVYIMLDAEGTVIYVGKARVLKNRVRQYFQHTQKPVKVQAMVDCISDFQYVVTPTEVDALALENTYIKKYKPKYNILLKDDKTYPYIKVHTREEFPRISVTRRLKKDGRYFGPFMGGVNCKEIVDVAAKVYHIRTCGVAVTAKPKKPCLNYHLGRCLAPCAHMITKEEYAKNVERVVSFLSGNYEEAERILKEKMARFAEEEQFELALDYRNKIEMLSKLKLRRITSMPKDVDADIWAVASNGLYTAVSMLVTRNGIMRGSRIFALENGAGDADEGFLSFLTQYYQSAEIPHEIILNEELDDELFRVYAFRKTGRSLILSRPKFGVKRELLDMAAGNATEYLEKSISAIQHKNDMTAGACARLQKLLGLTRYPRRMECYDISNISGVDKVGSMVVFTDGEADKTQYRRFRIKTVEGANDFASLQEVLTRRLSKLGTADEGKFEKPQLIVIDGGKGQLTAVKTIFDGMNVEGIDLIALAKQEEEIYTLSGEDPIKIDRRDFALKMLQRIRDEAHRFAITYFRSLHGKRNLASVLEEIDGIGAKKRAALMKKFGSIDAVMRADTDDLAKAEGIGKELAEKIKKHFEEL